MMTLLSNAMPIAGFAGGLLIGLSAALMLLGLGRIAGVSGLASRAIGLSDTGAPWGVAAAFVIGLPVGAWLVATLTGGVEVTFPDASWPLIVGGLLVGYGTRLGSGCTSGHGVCGLSRLSPRSMVATALFMASGFLTVGLLRMGGVL